MRVRERPKLPKGIVLPQEWREKLSQTLTKSETEAVNIVDNNLKSEMRGIFGQIKKDVILLLEVLHGLVNNFVKDSEKVLETTCLQYEAEVEYLTKRVNLLLPSMETVKEPTSTLAAVATAVAGSPQMCLSPPSDIMNENDSLVLSPSPLHNPSVVIHANHPALRSVQNPVTPPLALRKKTVFNRLATKPSAKVTRPRTPIAAAKRAVPKTTTPSRKVADLQATKNSAKRKLLRDQMAERSAQRHIQERAKRKMSESSPHPVSHSIPKTYLHKKNHQDQVQPISIPSRSELQAEYEAMSRCYSDHGNQHQTADADAVQQKLFYSDSIIDSREGNRFDPLTGAPLKTDFDQQVFSHPQVSGQVHSQQVFDDHPTVGDDWPSSFNSANEPIARTCSSSAAVSSSNWDDVKQPVAPPPSVTPRHSDPISVQSYFQRQISDLPPPSSTPASALSGPLFAQSFEQQLASRSVDAVDAADTVSQPPSTDRAQRYQHMLDRVRSLYNKESVA